MSMGTNTPLTPDDLLLLPRPENGRHYELREGELIVVGILAGGTKESSL